MCNRNVRRLCGIAIGLGPLLAFSTDALATRGRVKVANNTIVTDSGTLIRGARVSLDIWDETPSQANITAMKNNRGLNAFHIYAEYPGSNQSAGYNAIKVDKVVDLADTNDLYVVLTIGSGGGNGTFNQSFVTAFWNFYAPRYKDKTHVVYEVCNEPQAWSAPYNSNTLTMEKNAYAQIRGLAPDTHIMMMSYSQPVNATQAATECAGLGVAWDNASVAFHTYGIDGKEDSSLTAFYTALKGKGMNYACTEPNLTLKVITTKLFERDGVSETQFINVSDIATNNSSFADWITSNKICWTPDFGTWPGPCSGAGGSAGTGGRSSTGGSTSIASSTGGRSSTGGSTSIASSTGGRSSTGGNTSIASSAGGRSSTSGNTSIASSTGGRSSTGGNTSINGTGGSVTGGHQGVGGTSSSADLGGSANGTGGKATGGGLSTGGGATAGGNVNATGGAGVGGGNSALGGAATGGAPANVGGGEPAGNTSVSNGDASQGSGSCSCKLSGTPSSKPWTLALLFGLGLVARRRNKRR